MSVTVGFDDGNGNLVDGDQIATNAGWLQFGQWAETLDAEKFERIVQLWEYGKTFREGLREQLQLAEEETDPPEMVLEIIRALQIEMDENPNSEGIWVEG